MSIVSFQCNCQQMTNLVSFDCFCYSLNAKENTNVVSCKDNQISLACAVLFVWYLSFTVVFYHESMMHRLLKYLYSLSMISNCFASALTGTQWYVAFNVCIIWFIAFYFGTTTQNNNLAYAYHGLIRWHNGYVRKI